MPERLPIGWHFAHPKLAEHYLRSFDLGPDFRDSLICHAWPMSPTAF
jgi:hypothetical protein